MNFRKRLFIGLGIIVGSIIIGLVALSYFSGDLNAKASIVVNNRASAESAAASVAYLAELQHDQPIAAQYQADINKLLPKQSALIGFPPEVATLAKADGVSATASFTGNPNIQPGAVGTVSFSVDAQGPLANIVTFLTDLGTKTPGYLLNINAYNVGNTSNGSALTVQGTLFFQ